MTWVYWRSERGLWTVGYYKPDGDREPESDHESAGAAAARVHFLNGGSEGAINDLGAAVREGSEDSRRPR